MGKDKTVVLAAQKKAKTNEPAFDDLFPVGTLATIIQLLKLPDGTVKALVEGKRRVRLDELVSQEQLLRGPGRGARRGGRAERGARGAAPPGADHLRGLRQAQQAHPAGDARQRGHHRRPGAARRHHRGPPLPQAAGQAVDPGDRLAAGAPREALRAHAGGDRDPAGGAQDPHPREEADGEVAEGVLPQRADAGDPEGAGRSRRVQERDPGARGEDPRQADVEGSHGPVPQGAEEAQDDEPDERRGHRGPELHRLDPVAPLGRGHRGQARRGRGREGPRRGPPRPAQGEGAHPRVPGRAGAGREDQGAHPLPGGSARRGQDLAGPQHRPRHGAPLRAHQPGRRAGRGRDPRPPAHLHRRHARQDPPVDPQGRRRPTRWCCSTRWTRCPPTSAATPRRRCSRCSTRSRTPPSSTTTSTSTTTSPRCSSSAPPTPCRASRCRCRTAWRSSGWPATPTRRSSPSPTATWCRASGRRTASPTCRSR